MPFIHAGREGDDLLRGEVGLGDHLAAHRWRWTERAKERGLASFTRPPRQRAAARRPLREVLAERRATGPRTTRRSARRCSTPRRNLDGVEWEELKKKGFARFTGIGNCVVVDRKRHGDRARRDDHAAHQARLREGALPHPVAAHAVLPRPGALPRDGRGAAAAQGPADGGRELPADAHRRAHALEHPRELARRPADAPAAARRAGDVHERRGRRGPRHRRRRSRARLQRPRRVRDHGQGVARGAPGPADRLPRLGELSSSRTARASRT